MNPSTENKQDLVQTISCKNCETQFVGNFCPNCGQSTKEFDRPFQFILVDFLGNLFAFDTRFWKTFISILTKPGQMAADFVKGKRVRYMPPFRFYVFISFIFFLLLNMLPTKIVDTDGNEVGTEQIDSLQNTLQENDVNLILKNNQLIVKQDSIEKKNIIKTKDENEKNKVEEFLSNRKFLKQTFLKYLSWMFFFLMPLYGCILWWLFRKQYKYYYVHLILAINQHAMTFLTFSIVLLLDWILPETNFSVEEILVLGLPVYYVIGIKQLYKRSWKSSILKFILAHSLYLVLLIVGIVLISIVLFSQI